MRRPRLVKKCHIWQSIQLSTFESIIVDGRKLKFDGLTEDLITRTCRMRVGPKMSEGRSNQTFENVTGVESWNSVNWWGDVSPSEPYIGRLESVIGVDPRNGSLYANVHDRMQNWNSLQFGWQIVSLTHAAGATLTVRRGVFARGHIFFLARSVAYRFSSFRRSIIKASRGSAEGVIIILPLGSKDFFSRRGRRTVWLPSCDSCRQLPPRSWSSVGELIYSQTCVYLPSKDVRSIGLYVAWMHARRAVLIKSSSGCNAVFRSVLRQVWTY